MYVPKQHSHMGPSWAPVGLQLGPERAHMGMPLDNIAVEGTVSQFFYIGPGSFFFSFYNILKQIFTKKIYKKLPFFVMK